ncbi:tudor domain-containing protein 5-like [Ciona intestinalis]
MSELLAEKNKVKKVIRSLLLSASCGLTPTQLERDYKQMAGEVLPYKKFHYMTSRDFLKSLRDTLVFTYDGSRAIIHGIADDKTEHIKKMITKQRKVKTYNSLEGPAEPKRSPRIKKTPSLYVPAFIRNNFFKVIKTFPNGFSISILSDVYSKVNGAKLHINGHGFENHRDLLLAMPDIVRLEFGRTNRAGQNLYVYPAKYLTQTKVHGDKNNNVENKDGLEKGATTDVESLKETTEKKNEDKVIDEKSSNKETEKKVEKLLAAKKVNPGPKQEVNTGPKQEVNTGPKQEVNNIFKQEYSPACQMLQRELLQLLSGRPNGTWSLNISSLYEQKYNKPLELKNYGYFSIIEFMSTLGNKVSMHRPLPTGDWFFNIRNPNQTNFPKLPTTDLTDVKIKLKQLMSRFNDGIVIECLNDLYQMTFNTSLPVGGAGVYINVETLLCKTLDVVKLCDKDGRCMVLPHDYSMGASPKQGSPIDAVGGGVCYRTLDVPPPSDDYIDIFVSHVVTPGAFMVQLIGDDTTVALDGLMDELEEFYCSNDAAAYRMPSDLINIGQVCVTVSIQDKNWNRALITKEPLDCGFVEILFVDYGDIASVNIRSLFLLKEKFLDLPAQMIRSRLSHVQPYNLGSWSLDSRRVMLDLCRNKPLVAKVTGVDNHNIMSLLICDTTHDTIDVYINDVLADQQFATLVCDFASSDELERTRLAVENRQIQLMLPLGAAHEPPLEGNVILDAPPPYQPYATPTNQPITEEQESFMTHHNINHDSSITMETAESSIVVTEMDHVTETSNQSSPPNEPHDVTPTPVHGIFVGEENISTSSKHLLHKTHEELIKKRDEMLAILVAQPSITMRIEVENIFREIYELETQISGICLFV